MLSVFEREGGTVEWIYICVCIQIHHEKLHCYD